MLTSHTNQGSLRVHTEATNGEVVVLVVGDLDTGSFTALRDTIAGLVLRGVDDIVVDMSGCTFMDSAGLTALLEARRGGAHLVVRNPSTHIERVLRVVAVESVIDIEVVDPTSSRQGPLR